MIGSHLVDGDPIGLRSGGLRASRPEVRCDRIVGDDYMQFELSNRQSPQIRNIFCIYRTRRSRRPRVPFDKAPPWRILAMR
jgi:hypothetical protein